MGILREGKCKQNLSRMKHILCFKKKNENQARMMDPQLRAWTILPEESGSSPSTLMGTHNHL